MDRREYAFEGTTPTIHERSNVSREATLVGDVTVEADASVWAGVVLRGDVAPVRVGERSAVGDNAVLHASTVGDHVMVGHGAVLNDATVADEAMIGHGAVLNAGTSIGTGSIVASGTVVPDGYDVPPESFVRGVPARATPLSETNIDAEEIFEAYSTGEYVDLASRHEDMFS